MTVVVNSAAAYSGSQGSTSSGGNTVKVVFVKDVKAAGSAGNTLSNTSTWEKVTLQTTEGDTSLVTSLSSSVITLAAGTYYVWGHVGGSRITTFKSRLRKTNNTAATSIVGSDAQAEDTGTNYIVAQSYLMGKITTDGTNTYELQRYYLAAGNDGYGANFGAGAETETYSQIAFMQVA